MRIALIGPGIMPIPPDGWGGVEHLIWNFYKQLKNNCSIFEIRKKITKNQKKI